MEHRNRIAKTVWPLYAVLLTLVFSGYCQAKDEAGVMSSPVSDEFSLREWSNENGLSAGDIYSMARTQDGFLWLATDAGLISFDGLRFRLLDTNQLPVPTASRVTCLLEDRAGVLWAGTSQGNLMRREQGRFQKEELHTDVTRINSLFESGDGTLWVATAKEGVLFRRQGQWQALKSGDNLPEGRADQLLVLTNGQVWIVSGKQLVRYDPKQNQFATCEIPSSQPVNQMMAGHDGSLWVTTLTTAIRGARIFRYLDGQWTEPLEPYPWQQASVLAAPTELKEDGAGRIWVCTVGSGVFYHAGGQGWQSIAPAGPLVDERVDVLLQDREGTLWFGVQGAELFQARPRLVKALRPDPSPAQSIFETTCIRRDGSIWGGTYGGGIYCNRDGHWTHYGLEQGLENQYVSAIYEDHQTNLWANTRTGVYEWDGTRFNRMQFLPRPDAFVLAGYEAKNGALWLSTHQGLVRYLDGDLIQFGKTDGLETGPDIRNIVEDSAGNIWTTIMYRGIFRQTGDHFEKVTPKEIPEATDYRALHFDTNGALWVATYGRGLYEMEKSGELRHWSVQDGLPSDYLVSLVEDKSGVLWLGSVNGILGLSRQELENYSPGQSLPLLGRRLTVADGLDSQICSGWGQPVATCGADGRICFPNQRALAVFDPATVRFSPLTLPVTVEEVRVDGTVVPPDESQSLHVASGVRRVEFQYTLPDLLDPSRTRFRYRLQGLDDDWVVTQQRSVDYNHLLPGNYEFHVMASGPDGAWHEGALPVKLEVVPRLWERKSVRIAGALGLIGSVAVVVWMISRARMQRRLLRLEAQQAAELERRRIARDLHDELGSGLTEIMQLGDLGSEDGIGADDLRSNARSIAQRTRRLAAALDEIVWTTNPRNDSLPKFTGYLCDYAQEFMRSSTVRCRLDVVRVPEEIQLKAMVRHNLLLACKEALRNVARHSGAREVWLRIRYETGRLQIVIEDDGHGFNPDASRVHGNGLKNIRERIETLGGEIKMASTLGKGTVLTFELPLSAK